MLVPMLWQLFQWRLHSYALHFMGQVSSQDILQRWHTHVYRFPKYHTCNRDKLQLKVRPCPTTCRQVTQQLDKLAGKITLHYKHLMFTDPTGLARSPAPLAMPCTPAGHPFYLTLILHLVVLPLPAGSTRGTPGWRREALKTLIAINQPRSLAGARSPRCARQPQRVPKGLVVVWVPHRRALIEINAWAEPLLIIRGPLSQPRHCSSTLLL